MKILIIGKNGQLGSSLCDKARVNHIHYIATDRATLDIADEQSVNRFFLQHSDFDFMINTAAYTNVDAAEKNSEEAHRANCCAIEYLANAAKKLNIPIIHISTDYVFDGEKNTAYVETDDKNPMNVYGKTKMDGEDALKKTWDKHIILRISWVFSEYGKNFLKTIAKLCDQKESLSIVCDQFGSPTSARSVAGVILKICNLLHLELNQERYFGVYHYTDFPATNWHQFATYIAQAKEKKMNATKIIYPIASSDYPTVAKRPKNSILNLNKINAVFDIKPSLWTVEVDRILNSVWR